MSLVIPPPIMLKQASPPHSAGQKIPIVMLTLAAFTLSLLIPLAYRTPEKNISYPRLSFLYEQYNPDSPVFLYSTLGFPDYYKKNHERASRPLFSMVAKGVSLCAKAAVIHLFPRSRLARCYWGGYLAIEHCAAYFTWLAMNALFLGLMLYFLAELMAPYVGQSDRMILLSMLAFSPPVLLALNWLHTVVAGWLIVAVSFVLLRRLMDKKNYIIPALLLGTLFLAKIQVTVFALGFLLFFDFRSWKPWLFAVMAIALPTLLWHGYCHQHGIIGWYQESGMTQHAWAHGSLPSALSRAAKMTGENLIGFLLLLNPLSLFFLCRGILRFPWRDTAAGLLLAFSAFELVALCALGRTGSMYMFDVCIIALPLLVTGIGRLPQERMPAPGKIFTAARLRVMVLAQLLWLPAAVYFQLLLWRNNRWF